MKKSGRETVADRMTNVLFTLPALLLYCVFFIYPVLLGINYSFTDWNGIAKEYTYIGFQNYWNLFKNPFFWQSMRITLMYTLILVVGVMFLSLVLSLSLNSMKHFQTFTKSVFFVPAMIGGVTIALIFDQIYYRVIPVIGHALGISALSQSPLAERLDCRNSMSWTCHDQNGADCHCGSEYLAGHGDAYADLYGRTTVCSGRSLRIGHAGRRQCMAAFPLYYIPLFDSHLYHQHGAHR